MENRNIIEFDAQSDSLDLKQVVKDLFRSWPTIIMIFLFWAFVGILLLKLIQPTYQLKSTILVEEPQRLNDPQRMTVGPQAFNPPDDEYFVNEKIRIKRFPLVSRALDSLNFNITYYKKAFSDKEIYARRPFTVKLSDEWDEDRADLPFGRKFEVKLLDEESFGLKINGPSAISKQTISINDSFLFGQKINIGKASIVIEKEKDHIGNDGQFSFVIKNKRDLALQILDKLDVKTEELSATVMGLYMTGPAPEKQIDLLNALGQLYIKEHLEEKKEIYVNISNFIEEQLNEIQVRLNETEKELEQFKSRNEINDLSKEAGMLLNQTTKLENEKVNLLVKKKYYDYLKEFLINADNYEKLISPLAFKINDPILVDLTNELVNLQMEKNDMVVQGNQANPSFALINSKISSIKTNILQTVEGFETSNNIRLIDINERLDQFTRDSKNIPKAEREYIRIERLLKLNEASYINLLEKKTDADIARGSVMSDFKILEPAYLIDTDPIFPNTLVIASIVLLFSILSIIAYLIYKMVYKSEVKSLNDLSDISKEIIVDGIIDFSNLTNPQHFAAFGDSFTAENFKALMLKILEDADDTKRTITVTSWRIGEGKTFISTGLALSLANTGYKVALIDLNSKHPISEKQFKAQPERTLFDYFTGDEKISGLATSTFNEDLFLIKGGPLKKVMSSFDNAKFKGLLSKLKRSFDHVIIDAGPLGLVSGVSSLIKTTDRTCIVFRRNKSQKDDWKAIKRVLPENSFSKIGMVFNGDIDKNEDLSKAAKKYYQNKRRGIIYRIKYILNKI
ncbi:MAG: AAA family ATPase [Flavobacteriales bacterium]|nr:AAA family ATPase [Flavobacteriales bacterium]